VPLPEDGLKEDHLNTPKSLLQVYICAAFAKIFFSIDIMRPIELERHFRRTRVFLHPSETDVEGLYQTPSGYIMRFYKTKDSTMFRLFCPLQVAMELCEEVHPECLTYRIADYLAGIVATYAGGASSYSRYLIDLTSITSVNDAEECSRS